jgi:predicted DNA-binding transcriptional regulator YafY
MSGTATRLITLIMLLQGKPNRKASELAGKLGVSERTVHRYITMLEEIGIPIYSERGPYGGFSLVRGYKIPPLVFTPEEAVALYLGTSLVEEMWGNLYQEAAQGALAKLENVLPDEQRYEIAWARRSLLATGMHRADLENLTPTLEKVRRAVREGREVLLVYQGRSKSTPLARKVDPYAMVLRWGWWYLVGYCHLRDALRSFQLDRFKELTLLEERFRTPENFDIQDYPATEFQTPPKIHVRLTVSAQAGFIVEDNPFLWENIEKLPDGSFEVTTSAPDLTWAASLVLSFGPLVAVQEPSELREMVLDWAGATVEMYENPQAGESSADAKNS